MSYQPLYEILLNYLTNRYPYLHSGELSVYLITLLLSIENKACYLITDDMQFRKKIPAIQQDETFIKLFGGPIPDIKTSGTIGIIKRLTEKRALTSRHVEEIITELENGSFFLTTDLIEHLRGTSS